MKLFTKIFLPVACVILILSSVIFFYTSYRWKKQSIQYINNYENNKFHSNLRQLEKGLRLSATQSSSSDSTLQRKILIYRFREIFHDSAVLYQNNEELYNGTIYDFCRVCYKNELPDCHLQRHYQCSCTKSDPFLLGRCSDNFSPSSYRNPSFFQSAKNHGPSYQTERCCQLCGTGKL